jgi:hypothetical protein
VYCTLHCTVTVCCTVHCTFTVYCTLHCTFTVYCTLHCTFTVYFLCVSRKYESKGFWRFSLSLKKPTEQWKNTVPVLHSIMYSFKGWHNNKNHAFPSKRCISNKKHVIFTHFTMKIIPMYRYISCNKKILFVKKYLSLFWVFTDFSIFPVAFWTQTLR